MTGVVKGDIIFGMRRCIMYMNTVSEGEGDIPMENINGDDV